MPGPSFDPATEVMARWPDGQVRNVPIEQAGDVSATGGQVLSQDEVRAQFAEEARREESESFQGQVRTGAGALVAGGLAPFAALAGGTGEQAAAGLFGAAEEAVTGRDMTLQNLELMQRDATYNPTIQMLGSTVGTTATSMLGGYGLGKAGGSLATALGADAAAATLATGGTLSQLAGRALTAAPGATGFLAENALGGIGAMNEQAFLENRELAADEVVGAGLVGAGLGMGIGLGARGLGAAGQKLGQAAMRAVPESAMQKLAGKAAFIDMADGASKRIFRGLGEAEQQQIGQRLLREGITGKTAQEAVDLLGGKLKDVGQKKGVIEALASPHFDADGLVAKIRAHADELDMVPTDESAAIARKLRSQADRFESTAKAAKGDISRNALEEVMSARKSIGQTLKKIAREGDTAAEQAYNRLYGDIADSLDSAVQRADDALGGGGGFSQEWRGLNTEYSQLKTASRAYKDRIAKESGVSPGLGLRDTMAGQGAALLGGVLTGNPLLGVATGIGTAAARKLVREKGAGWVARAADHFAQRGEVPSVTKLLAVSSQARQQLGKYAVGQMVQGAARKIAASEEAPAGFAFGALANYSDPKAVSDQYASVTRAMQAADGDIEGMATRANEHLGALANEQPELAAAAQMKMANAIGYLRENMPAQPPQSVLAIAAGTQSAKLPPSHEQVSWLKRYRATVDPSVIYGEIARGHINPETIETLQTLYPAYLASVQMGTLEALNAMPGAIAKLPYSRRLALDTLMGGTGQVEPTRRFTVQDRLAQANAEATQQAAAPAPSGRKPPEIAQFATTTSARLMST